MIAATAAHREPLASWARTTRPSALQTMLTLTARPGIVSLALGLPAPDLFPTEDLRRVAENVLQENALALQYAPPMERLKAHVVALMAARGVSCTPTQVFLTAGAQQGMSLLATVLLERRGRVAIERLAYSGFRQVLQPLSPDLTEIPSDPATGMDVDALARALASGLRPSFIYTVPQGHNPLGVSMPADAGARLAALADRYGVPVIEDDAYGFLQYRETLLPPVRASAPQWGCYVGSFSKILAPGLRQGWLVVPAAYVPALSIAKEASDINTATLAQRILCAYLEAGRLPAHVEMLRREYRRKRDAMLSAMAEHFPGGARWHAPEAGLFAWVELPAHVCAEQMLRRAVEEERVAFLPGNAFSVDGLAARHCMRLNFSHAPVPVLEDGIRRLGRLLSRTEGAA